MFCVANLKKNEEKKYHTVRTDPKSNEQIVETGAKQLYTWQLVYHAFTTLQKGEEKATYNSIKHMVIVNISTLQRIRNSRSI